MILEKSTKLLHKMAECKIDTINLSVSLFVYTQLKFLKNSLKSKHFKFVIGINYKGFPPMMNWEQKCVMHKSIKGVRIDTQNIKRVLGWGWGLQIISLV